MYIYIYTYVYMYYMYLTDEGKGARLDFHRKAGLMDCWALNGTASCWSAAP